MVAPVGAASASSTAASAGSTTVGSVSDSIQGSSNTSSKTTVAAGDYRVVNVAAAPDKPGVTRVALVPAQTATPGVNSEALAFTLDVPTAALGARPLLQHDTVSVAHRPYGLAFARTLAVTDSRAAGDGPGAAKETFFLVVANEWRGDFESKPIGRRL